MFDLQISDWRVANLRRIEMDGDGRTIEKLAGELQLPKLHGAAGGSAKS